MQVRARITTTLLAVCAGVALLFVPNARANQFTPDRYGIGAVFVQPGDSALFEVKGCSQNGPAARAGLQPGDRLLEIDGQSVRGWTVQQITSRMSADKPLPVRITIQRGADVLSFEIVRMRLADIAAANGFRWEDEDGKGTYRMVPLREVPPLNVGDVVPLDSLTGPACRPATASLGKRSTLVYFWASWCAPCKLLIKELRNVSPDVGMIAIGVDSTCDEFKTAVAAEDPPGAVFWQGGWYGRLPQALGVYRRGIPTAALLDSEGRLVRVATGVEPILEMIRPDSTGAR